MPSREFLIMFLKSIIAKDKWSIAFVLMTFHGSTIGLPWIFKGSKVTWLKCTFALEFNNIRCLDKVGEDLHCVVKMYSVFTPPLDHFELQVVLSRLPNKSNHRRASGFVPNLQCLLDLVVDLPRQQKCSFVATIC